MEDIVNEPAVAYNKRYFSVEEYLEQERITNQKHEYFDEKSLPRLERAFLTIKYLAICS